MIGKKIKKTLIVITTTGRYRRRRSEKGKRRHALRRRPRVIVSACSFLFARVKNYHIILLSNECVWKKKKNRITASTAAGPS